MKQRPTFCRYVRAGRQTEGITPFEKLYVVTWNFKKLRRARKEDRIKFLIECSHKVIRNNREQYKFLRERKFTTRKKCGVCREQWAVCQHHIIQLQNGGYNSSVNRVPICRDCHAEIHPWLKKENDEK